ncbi:MAG TPA: alpha/beta hydrolase [Chloroflexi bacterium]|nr:alpha/beta hydrolase [Chloroflexota bacterium]
MSKRKQLALGAVSGTAAILGWQSYRQYQRDRQAALARIAAHSRTAETRLGSIVYGKRGEGPPVLVIHGAGGGFDQALHVAEGLAEGFEWIAPSRFGYLGTPLPEDGSPAAQANAHAALLDFLGIERAAVIGMSAGGPSALQFALRYPERCTGLVMMAGVSQGMLAVSPNLEVIEKLVNWLYASDYLTWLGLQLAIHRLVPSLGVPLSVTRSLSAADKAWLRTLLEYALPIRERTVGLIHDYVTVLSLEVLPLAQIRVPTLIVHARDDGLVSLKHAQFCVENIPQAQMLELPRGGHLFLGQRAPIRAVVEPFLRAASHQS